MRYPALILIVVLLGGMIPPGSAAQVIVRDTIIISPLVIRPDVAGAGEQPSWKTLSYQFKPAGYCSATMAVSSACGYTASVTGSGSSPDEVRIDLTIQPLVESYYTVTISRSGDYCGHRLVMYNADGSIAWKEDCGSLACHCGLMSGFSAVYYSDFSISSMPEICAGSATSVQPNPQMTPCLSTAWFSTSPVTYTIVHGGEYGGLCASDGQILQQSLSGTTGTLPYVRFNGNGRPVIGREDSVVVRIDVAGVGSKSHSLRITPVPVEDIGMIVADKTVTAGDSLRNQAVIEVTAYTSGQNGCPFMPDSLPVRLECSTGTWGHLVDASGSAAGDTIMEGIRYSDIAAGMIRFVADAAVPDTPVEVIVTARFAGEVTASGVIRVDHPPECLVLRPGRGQINPGETTTFTVGRRRYDGSVVSCPSQERFDVYVTDGYGAGRFHGMNEDSTWNDWYIGCTTDGFSYTANDSITGDSVRVGFYIMGASWCGPGSVYMDDCGAPSASLLITRSSCVDVKVIPPHLGPGDTARIEVRKVLSDGTLAEFPVDQLFDVSIVRGANAAGLIADGLTGIVSSLTSVPAGFRLVAGEHPGGDSVGIGILVLPVNGGTRKSKRHILQDQCSLGTADIGLKLVLTRPAMGVHYDDPLITADPPRMPDVECRAMLRGAVGDVTFNWEFEVVYGLPNREADTIFRGSSYGFNESETWWNVPLAGKWWGGWVTIRVEAVCAGKSYTVERVRPYKIVGENPGILACQDASRGLQAIMFVESTFRQFETCVHCYENPANPVGFTLHGEDSKGPGGFGICQITNPVPSQAELWNWVYNREKGNRLVNELITRADRFPILVRENGHPKATDFTLDEELMKQIFLYYNRGPRYNYWRWNDTSSVNGGWERNNAAADTWMNGRNGIYTGRCYADETWRIYQACPCGDRWSN